MIRRSFLKIVLDFRCLLIVDISWIKKFLSIRFSRYKTVHKFSWTEWRWWDSNSWPPACKAGALPTELHPHIIRQPPILPYRCQYSTFGRLGLNRRVRDGNGCYPKTHRHRKNMLLRSHSRSFPSPQPTFVACYSVTLSYEFCHLSAYLSKLICIHLSKFLRSLWQLDSNTTPYFIPLYFP